MASPEYYRQLAEMYAALALAATEDALRSAHNARAMEMLAKADGARRRQEHSGHPRHPVL